MGLGFVGEDGWISAAMGRKLLLQDVAMNISKNFLQHTVAYFCKEFFVRFGIANVFAGFVSGGYSWLSNIFNKEGAFFGF